VSANGSVATIIQNGIDIIVFGDIGLISVGRINSTDRVNMSIVNVRELDANNQVVGVAENHNVDLTGFEFSLGAIFSTQVDGIRATAANISTILLDNSQLVLTVLVLEEDGQLVLGADSHDASAGAVKVRASSCTPTNLLPVINLHI
jgi:glyceraldehyde-3-phosphate dehydrogenase/erythrose-4-phosphate dehydrogenase